MRIAINGFGRIGRQFYRIADSRPEIEVVAVNDLADPKTLVHLLKYDSVYGKFEGELRAKILAEKDPANLPWKDFNVDVVIESTGRFTDCESASKHLAAGAKKVIISANSKDADFSIVLGVNQEGYDPKKHQIIANCSCTTNAAAPVIKVLHENFRVLKAQMITIHAVTAAQSLVDGPNKNLRRGRAAFASIIPQPTGAHSAVVRVLPELKGRVNGSAFRVPVLSGSVLEVVAQVERETSKEEANECFRKQAEGKLKGILAVSDDDLVSVDIVRTPFSAIVDLPLTEVIDLKGVTDENMVKVVAWYDNEWGYSRRLVDLALLVGSSI